MSNYLDLGCGTNPQNSYKKANLFGIDIRDDAKSVLAQRRIAIRKANLVFERIPFEDNFLKVSRTYIFWNTFRSKFAWGNSNEIAYPFINLTNEIWRVLFPRDRFITVTPAFPLPLAFADPTHENYIAQGTHEYFCGERPDRSIYGFHGRFIEHIAKLSVPTNYRNMSPNPLKPTVRDLGRRLSRNGLHHMVWELEVVK